MSDPQVTHTRSSHLYRESGTYLLLASAHRHQGSPGRFTPADMDRRMRWPRGHSKQFFKGYSNSKTDQGDIPTLTEIRAVAEEYGLAPRTLLDRLLEDAGYNDATDVQELEAAANTVLRYVRAIQSRQAPPG